MYQAFVYLALLGGPGVAVAKAKARTWWNVTCEQRLIMNGMSYHEMYERESELKMISEYKSVGEELRHLSQRNQFDPLLRGRLHYLHVRLQDSTDPEILDALARYEPFAELQVPPLNWREFVRSLKDLVGARDL